MATIQYVKKLDDFVRLQTVLVSCSNKEGLTSNTTQDGGVLPGIPETGLLGVIAEQNPDVLFLSTGGTYALLQSAGLNVMEGSLVVPVKLLYFCLCPVS